MAGVKGQRVNVPGLGKRRDRTIQQSRHDIYQPPKGKLPEPTECPGCGAFFHEGRWSWDKAPAESRRTLCPACRRVKAKNPAGYLKLRGPSIAAHRGEILSLIRNEAAKEGKEHPLSRIMGIEEGKKQEILVSTTDTHLPQRIGEALRHAFHGELTMRYSKDQQLVRAYWTE